jgi:hypothetical protein
MTAFTDADLSLLRRLVGRVIPASSEYVVPGADDEVIFADIVQTLGRHAAVVRSMLATLDAGELRTAPSARVDETIQILLGSPEPAMGEVVSVVAQCYYRDDRVMRSLGMEPRPPFPKGFEVEQGDWSLLDPVRARPRIWRDVP